NGGRHTFGTRSIPGPREWNPIGNGIAAQSIDDGQEPRAGSTRSASPIPPGAQCGLLHDVHRLVGAVAHVAGEQEGRMAHLAEGGLERARFIVFDLVCPGSWTLHDTSDHSPRSICLIDQV